jgi:hypothetical protein
VVAANIFLSLAWSVRKYVIWVIKRYNRKSTVTVCEAGETCHSHLKDIAPSL